MKHIDRHVLEALLKGTDSKTALNTLNGLTEEELYELLKNIL